jgi:peptidoglycan/LPS O-acetylase OafA/YrhL
MKYLTTNSKYKYRPEIDGLRAIAVTSVILYHLGFSSLKGGYIGVDIFFIISGFLITSIITQEIEKGTFTITNFYEKRARRILPALTLILFLSAVASWFFLPPHEFINFTKSLFYVILFISNIFFWRDGDYFVTDASLKPLLHTWSLAVEEQFYLFFPFFLFALKKIKKNIVFIGILVSCILSLALAQYASVSYKVANFYSLPTRFWELGLGALCSIRISNVNKINNWKKNNIISLIGLTFIIYAILFYDEKTPFPSLFTLIPAIGTALILLYSSKNLGIGKLLANRGLVFVGLISYSAYLIHQPLIAFQNIYFGFNQSTIYKLVTLLSIFFLAFLSYRYVESPFRNRDLISTKSIVKFSFYATIFLLIYSIYIFKIMPFSFEDDLAKNLSKDNVIYSTNMDERKFIMSRIKYEEKRYNSLILGSSRVMQISEKFQHKSLINLGVSGASVEDIIAIGNMAIQRFRPKIIYIGVDPWLFNLNSGENRWKSIESEYKQSLNIILKLMKSDTLNKMNFQNNTESSLGHDLYNLINLSAFSIPQKLNDSPGIYDKIRSDGSRVYNLKYSNLTETQIDESIEGQSFYKIENYKFSKTAYINFLTFLKYIQNKSIEIILVLSPYHPTLYNNLINNNFKIIEIENKFRVIATSLNIQILGSYDSKKCGCTKFDFYDGLHPKDNCINSIISKSKSVSSTSLKTR